MLTIEALIAVLSFGLTSFGIGYTLGRNTKKIIVSLESDDYFL